MSEYKNIDDQTRTQIEAAVFRKMMAHFQKYPEVQNIELMNLAYFCRNCFSKWYRGAANDLGIDLDYEQARNIIYGMSYSEYKQQYQKKATNEQLDQFETSQLKATE